MRVTSEFIEWFSRCTYRQDVGDNGVVQRIEEDAGQDTDDNEEPLDGRRLVLFRLLDRGLLYREALHFPGHGGSQLLDIGVVRTLGLRDRRLVGMVQGIDHGAIVVGTEIDEGWKAGENRLTSTKDKRLSSFLRIPEC